MSPSAPDCVFCKIVAGDIPADVRGRPAPARAVKGLNPPAAFPASAAADPASVGHAVVLADEVARAAGVDDYRLVANTGAGAGQTVFHTHFHVLGQAPGMTESLI